MKLGIIGTGSRTQDYIAALKAAGIPALEITALADIDGARLQAFARENFGPGAQPALYTNYRELLADPEIQAVLICTPDTTHREIAIASIRSDKHILLEKPLATTFEDCVEIYRESLGYTKAFRLAFGLRYTDFYRTIREIVSSGRLGTLVAVEAVECLGIVHAASFFRRWQRFRQNNGGFLNYKCCHGLDVLNWVTGLTPVSVSAFGGRSFFNSRPDAAARCSDCGLTNCDFVYAAEDYHELFGKFNSLEDLCVYNCDKDIVDHESVIILYENGVTASFTVSMLSAEANNTMSIFGSEATLAADGRKGEIKVKNVHGGMELRYDFSHGAKGPGSEVVMLRSLFDEIQGGGPFQSDAKAGLMSSGLALLAEMSMEHRRAYDISLLFEGKTGSEVL